MFARRSGGCAGGGEVRPGAKKRLPAARHLRQRKFLSGSAGPGNGNRDANQSRSRPAFARNGNSAGSHERLPLPDAFGLSRARSADVHSDRQDDERRAADEVCHRSVLFQDGRGDGRSFPGAAGRGFADGDDRGALQREDPARHESVSRSSRFPKGTRRIRISRKWRARDF